jgi:hypothetical protein
MRTIRGFFSGGGSLQRAGYVWGRVQTFMPPVQYTDVTFRIATGSPITVLFDTDLLAVIYSLLPPGAATPAAVMAFMHAAPAVFQPQGPFWSPGGQLADIFSIKVAALYFPDANGKVPRNALDIYPVYGGFTARFLSPESVPDRSVLGRDALARIHTMSWDQAGSITLNGV